MTRKVYKFAPNIYAIGTQIIVNLGNGLEPGNAADKARPNYENLKIVSQATGMPIHPDYRETEGDK